MSIKKKEVSIFDKIVDIGINAFEAILFTYIINKFWRAITIQNNFGYVHSAAKIPNEK